MKIQLVILSIVFVGGIGGYFLYNETKLSDDYAHKESEKDALDTQEKPKKTDTVTTYLDTAFTLQEDQTAVFAGEEYQIRIIEFINSPCPEGSYCVWSGVGLKLKHTYKGESVVKSSPGELSHFGYTMKIIDSDYETYAKLKVTKQIGLKK